MSTTTTLRSVAQTATTADVDPAARLAEYRARVDLVRRSYRRRACHNGIAANGLSLLLGAAGAAVGLSPLVGSDVRFTAGLGVAVILLEGIARVMKPALHATRARRVARRLDREFRLYDAQREDYRCGNAKGDAAFVVAVERILAQADAAEEHDESGASNEPATPRKAA
ncbi:MAG TPA: hypothetical protein VH502_11290 [Actinoplanes sp.]